MYRASRNPQIGVLGFCFVSFVYLLVQIFAAGQSVMFEIFGRDARAVVELSSDIAANLGEGSFEIAAYVYSVLGPQLSAGYVFLVGLSFLALLFTDLRSGYSVAVVSVLAIAPIVLLFLYFQKDTITATAIIACALLFRSRRIDPYWATGWVAAIYLMHGTWFRTYYLLIMAVFAFGLLVWRRPGPQVLLVYLGVALIVLSVPNEFIVSLQEHRDMVNASRLGTFFEARTGFSNLIDPTGPGSFTVNYLFACWHIFVLPVFSLHPSDLLLFANTCVWFFYLKKGLAHPDVRIFLPSLLFFSHLAVLPVFEPDLGSFLRHASTPLPYLGPIIAAISREPTSSITPVLGRS